MHAYVAHTTSKAECGRLCNRVCVRLCCSMRAGVADNAVRAYLWQTVRLHACLCSTDSLCSRICNCMYTYVIDYAIEFMPMWQIQPVCKMCDYMHTCVADYAKVFMIVWHIQHA